MFVIMFLWEDSWLNKNWSYQTKGLLERWTVTLQDARESKVQTLVLYKVVNCNVGHSYA